MNDKIKQLLALAEQYSDEIGVIGVNIHPRLLSRIVRLDSTDLLDDSLMDDTLIEKYQSIVLKEYTNRLKLLNDLGTEIMREYLKSMLLLSPVDSGIGISCTNLCEIRTHDIDSMYISTVLNEYTLKLEHSLFIRNLSRKYHDEYHKPIPFWNKPIYTIRRSHENVTFAPKQTPTDYVKAAREQLISGSHNAMFESEKIAEAIRYMDAVGNTIPKMDSSTSRGTNVTRELVISSMADCVLRALVGRKAPHGSYTVSVDGKYNVVNVEHIGEVKDYTSPIISGRK